MNKLESAIASVPAGCWAVGVSGGADSVALLLLLRGRSDLTLHVVHLDHQTRGEQSTGDAEFVRTLCRRLEVPCTVARREEVEPKVANLPANPSAKYRALRHALFVDIVRKEKLRGVLLAHHAGDQAETVLLRLLRGGGRSPRGLSGMPRGDGSMDCSSGGRCWALRRNVCESICATSARTGGRMRAIKPRVTPATDCGNGSGIARRLANRFWHWRRRCGGAAAWARSAAPVLGEEFAAEKLASLPRILARESARRWLAERGVPPALLSVRALDRLREMAADAATPARLHSPADCASAGLAGGLELLSGEIKNFHRGGPQRAAEKGGGELAQSF